jgi:hypothetical protein
MSKAAIIRDINLGGIADSDYQGSKNTVAKMVGLDIHSTPGLIKVNQKLSLDSGTTVTEYVKVAIACSNGHTYWFSSESGKIWDRDGSGNWTLCYTTVPGSGDAFCLGAREYAGYIYWATQNGLHRIPVSKVDNWTDGAEIDWAELNLEQEEIGGTDDGYLLKDEVIEDVLGYQSHNYGTTVTGGQAIGEANATTKSNIIAQAIETYGEQMHSFAFYKATDTGTFTGTVTFAIRNCALVSGYTDRYQPIGVDLIALTITNAQWNLLPVGWNKIDLPYTFKTITYQAILGQTPTSINPNRYIPQVFSLVVYTSTSDNSNHPNLGYHGSGYAEHGRLSTYNATDGWTYTNNSLDLIVDYTKSNISRMIFTAHEVAQYGIGLNIKVVGHYDWIVTVHDVDNNVITTKTLPFEDLVSGWNTILWDAPWSATIGKSYHLHITYTDGRASDRAARITGV